MTAVLAWLGAGVVVAWLAWAAWYGEGRARRLAQAAWCRIWSLSGYRRTGRRHPSLSAIVADAGVGRAERIVRRVAPMLAGWFSPYPTDKGGFHDYLAVYDELLLPYRDREGLQLLEVGVHKGGSLALWREYFPASATIVGLDANWGVQTFPRDVGIKVVIADSRDGGAVAAALAGRRFDVIIDDGLHHQDAQRRSYAALRPFLAADGVYVIEDVDAFDPADYAHFGDAVSVVADRSGQSIVVLRPFASIAAPPSAARATAATSRA